MQTTRLNELCGGDFEGLTHKEIKKYFPEEYAERMANKLAHRYPGIGGESYMDVIVRLKRLILEVLHDAAKHSYLVRILMFRLQFERCKKSMLIVCHHVSVVTPNLT